MKFDKLFKKKRIIANVVSIAVVTSSLLNIPIDGQGTLGRKVSAAVNNYGLSNPVLTKEDGSGTTTWDSIYFGHYLQEDTNGDGTVDEKDEKQPIKWRVLSVDGDDAFLMADQGLDCKPYNETDTDVTWETCTLRSWLNGYDASNNVDKKDYNNDNFINTAFTAAERSAIKYSWVVNNDNPSYGTEGGNSTIDKVYLLSVDEAADATYGFYTKFGNSNVTREMSVTAFAREKNAYNSSSSSTDYEGNGDWWLRSPGYDRCASVIYGSGYGNQYGLRIYGVNITVRPVLHLNLSSSALWSYGGRVSGKDSSMAVTEMPIPTASAGKTSRPVSRPAIVVTGPSVVPCTTSGIVTTPRVTSTPEPTERPDEENQAFLMFTDKDWNWSNLNTKITGGNGKDTVITGNGTYTVSINKSDFSDGSMVENPANGAKVFGVDIQGICNTQKFDASKMAISDVIVKCDGKEITTDQSKMYEGNIEGKGNYRLEIRNEYGYGDGDFATKDEFDEMNPDFTFEDSLSVTFTITGIKEGKTPEGAFVDKNDRSVVEVGGKRAQRVAEEEVTLTPEPTERPDEENQAFLMFTDKDWNWSNWNTKITGGNGQDAVITGNGTYTVSINKSDFSDGSEVENPANGAGIFGVDIQGICNTQKFDASKMAISDVIVKCDGKDITTDQSKMYEGNIEGKGNYRLEIRNEWGYGYGDFATKDEFDEMNPDFTFEDSLSVTFTITGIKEGKTPEGAFVDKDDRSVVEVGGKRAQRVAEENVTPAPEITRVPSTEIPTRMPPTRVPTKVPSTPEPTQKTDAENTSTTTPGVNETFMPTDSPVNSPGTDNTVPIHSNGPEDAQQTPSASNATSSNGTGASGSADGKISNESTVFVKNVKAGSVYKKKAGYRYQKIVKLSWDQSENADGFYIYRRESISGEKRIADISTGDATDYTDSGVKMGESYTYRVLPYGVQDTGEITAGTFSSKVTVKIGTTIKKPKAKIKTSGKRMTLTFSTVEGDTYETQYRWIGEKKWKKQSKIKGKIKKKIIKSLNAKGFSLRVRTCTVINGHKVYSKWSAPMKVK